MTKEDDVGDTNLDTSGNGQYFRKLQEGAEARCVYSTVSKEGGTELAGGATRAWSQPCLGREGPELGWRLGLTDWVYCVSGQAEHLQGHESYCKFW